MAITVAVTPGKVFAPTEKIDNDKLNQLGQPSFVISGTVQASDVAAGAITSAKTTVGPYSYATSAFAAAVYTLTFTSATAPTSLVDGLEVWFKASNDNTGATSVNVGTGGNVLVYKNISQALALGDIIAGQMVGIRYNSAIPAPISAAGWELVTSPLLPASFVGTTAGTAPTYTVTITPPAGANALTLASLDGRPIILKIHSASVGSDTLTVTIGTTALAAKAIKKYTSIALAANDLRANQKAVFIYSSDTDTFQLQNASSNTIDPPALIAGTRNLIIKPNATSPNSKIDVTADEAIMKTTAGAVAIVSSVSITLDMGATEENPNARDSGTELADKWYYIWLIYNGTTTAGVLSISPTAPNMNAAALVPYTYKALIGMAYNDAGSNFDPFFQVDRRYHHESVVVFDTFGPLSGLADTYELLASTQVIAFRSGVPPVAKTCFGVIGGMTGEASMAVAACNDDGTLASTIINATTVLGQPAGGLQDGFLASAPFEVAVRGQPSYNIQWKSRTNTARNRLVVTGFTF